MQWCYLHHRYRWCYLHHRYRWCYLHHRYRWCWCTAFGWLSPRVRTASLGRCSDLEYQHTSGTFCRIQFWGLKNKKSTMLRIYVTQTRGWSWKFEFEELHINWEWHIRRGMWGVACEDWHMRREYGKWHIGELLVRIGIWGGNMGNDILGVACEEWHMRREYGKMTYWEWLVRSGILGVACDVKCHLGSGILGVACEEWHIRSGM